MHPGWLGVDDKGSPSSRPAAGTAGRIVDGWVRRSDHSDPRSFIGAEGPRDSPCMPGSSDIPAGRHDRHP
ncbi:MAG: hypothetical protein ACRDOI_04130 [Trebonia sp.]